MIFELKKSNSLSGVSIVDVNDDHPHTSILIAYGSSTRDPALNNALSYSMDDEIRISLGTLMTLAASAIDPDQDNISPVEFRGELFDAAKVLTVCIALCRTMISGAIVLLGSADFTSGDKKANVLRMRLINSDGTSIGGIVAMVSQLNKSSFTKKYLSLVPGESQS
jgi:hypothetical protein